MIQNVFHQLLESVKVDTGTIEKYWSEIEKHYTDSNRHYHTLTHLETIYTVCLPLKVEIADWETFLFTLFYHDIIYSSIWKDNEEQSADLAVKRLGEINYPKEKIEHCRQMILATKNHTNSTNNDINIFTDADLSILGTEGIIYQKYTQQIRQEYNIYPDIIYNNGRKKVIQHFLAMQQIFKTDYFHQRYEKQAKLNLRNEFKGLLS